MNAVKLPCWLSPLKYCTTLLAQTYICLMLLFLNLRFPRPLNISSRTLCETEFIVDLQKIQEENFKLTVLQDYSSSGGGSSSGRGFRGSNITMASSFLGKIGMNYYGLFYIFHH